MNGLGSEALRTHVERVATDPNAISHTHHVHAYTRIHASLPEVLEDR